MFEIRRLRINLSMRGAGADHFEGFVRDVRGEGASQSINNAVPKAHRTKNKANSSETAFPKCPP